MSRFTIRQAALTDIDAIAELFDRYRQFYGRASDINAVKAFIISRFNHGDSAIFLAYHEGIAAGFAQLYPGYSSVSLARTFILNDLFVSEDFRRQGLAAQLLAASREYAGALGAIRLTLSTATSNTAAQALYESQGWKRDEQFHVYHFANPSQS